MKSIVITNKILFVIGFWTLSTYSFAGSTTLQYEHNWKQMNRIHGDTIKLIHKRDSGWQFEFKFGTTAGSGSNKDVAYDDMQGGSGGIVIQKPYSLPNNYGQLIPSFETSFGNNQITYQPGLKYAYKINTDWSTSFRYRYEWKKITNSDRYKTAIINGTQKKYLAKGDSGRNRLDWNLSYSGFSVVGLSYTFNYYVGDYTNTPYRYSASEGLKKVKYSVYNNKKTDYEQQFKITWNYSKKLRPYVEFSDVSKNSDNDTRQAKYKVGFNYTF